MYLVKPKYRPTTVTDLYPNLSKNCRVLKVIRPYVASIGQGGSMGTPYSGFFNLFNMIHVTRCGYFLAKWSRQQIFLQNNYNYIAILFIPTSGHTDHGSILTTLPSQCMRKETH